MKCRDRTQNRDRSRTIEIFDSFIHSFNKHSLSFEVANHAFDGSRVDLRLQLSPILGTHVRAVPQRGVHVAGEHEGGRIIAVNRVQRGGIEVHRGVVRENDGVVTGLAWNRTKQEGKRVGTKNVEEFRAVHGRNVAEVGHHYAGGCEWKEEGMEYRDSALRRDR